MVIDMKDYCLISDGFRDNDNNLYDTFSQTASYHQLVHTKHILKSQCYTLSINNKVLSRYLMSSLPEFREMFYTQDIRYKNKFFEYSDKNFNHIRNKTDVVGFRFQVCCVLSDDLINFYNNRNGHFNIAEDLTNQKLMTRLNGLGLSKQFNTWLGCFRGLLRMSREQIKDNIYLITGYKKERAGVGGYKEKKSGERGYLFILDLFLQYPMQQYLTSLNTLIVREDVNRDDAIEEWYCRLDNLSREHIEKGYMRADLMKAGYRSYVNVILYADKFSKENLYIMLQRISKLGCHMVAGVKGIYTGEVKLRENMKYFLPIYSRGFKKG